TGRPDASAPGRRRSGFRRAGWRSITAAATRPRRARSASTPPAPCCCTRRTPRGSSATPDSIFEPTAEFERSGFVPDVVFPTGVVETEDTFLVYYGAADTCTAVVE